MHRNEKIIFVITNIHFHLIRVNEKFAFDIEIVHFHERFVDVLQISFFRQRFRNAIYVNDRIHKIHLRLSFFKNIDVDANEYVI